MFQKGHEKVGGREKGTPNKNNADIINAIREAFELKGGVKYLQTLPDNLFIQLVLRILPKDVQISGKDGESILFTIRGLNDKGNTTPTT